MFWEALTYCPGAQCLTQGLSKYSQICCTWEETYFSTVWNHKTKITSIGRYLLNTDSYEFGFICLQSSENVWVTDAASFATEPGSPEHSCHSLCDRERAVHDRSWQSHCPHQTFHQLFFLRTCFISLENFLQDYYILFYSSIFWNLMKTYKQQLKVMHWMGDAPPYIGRHIKLWVSELRGSIFNSMWTKKFQTLKLDLEKAEESEIKLQTSVGS